MAQPSQVFPPWLSQSVVETTDAAGNVATETDVVYIPPTYLGPSIPLGSLYIFGGTTEPPTILLPGATTLSSQVTTSAIPTTSLLTTTATPTSVLTSSLSSTSATPSSFTPSSVSLTSSISSQSTFSSSTQPSISQSTTSSTSAPTNPSIGHSSGLTRGQLVGVIVASILGLIFFFVLALFLFLCLKGRRNRRQFANLSDSDDDYYIVPPGGRIPGEGSPRHSGEEADPFLQQSSVAATGGGVQDAALGTAPGTNASNQPTPRNPPNNSNNGSGSSASSNSHASGFGVLLDRPVIGYLPSMPEHEIVGVPLSPSDMERIGRQQALPDESDQYEDEEYLGAYAYSREPQVPNIIRTQPTAATPLLGDAAQPFVKQPSGYFSEKSSFEHEDATVQVARRVKVEDLGSRTLSQQTDTTAGPSTHRPNSGLLAALGLGALANIGRKSWFRNVDSPRQSVSTPELKSDPLSEKDLESGRALLSPDVHPADSFGQRVRATAVGTGPDGLRPSSGVSARTGTSGSTIYHDAQSSIPGTPAITPLPRALTPTEPASQVPGPPEQAWLSSPLAAQPPAYSHHPPTSSVTLSSLSRPMDDILDMPAPTALNHFSSLSSIKETPTGSSFSSKQPPFFPPGLDTIRPVGWSSDTATDVSASRGSFGPSFGTGLGLTGIHDLGAFSVTNHGLDAVSIDILEEAPPDAEQGWRTITSGGFIDYGRRSTFGLFTPGLNVTSEQGSLHSMGSDFTHSVRSTGSAPFRHDVGSINSNSSRPSAHSVAQSMGSGFSIAHSLVRQGSITSEDRRPSRLGAHSPALSAFGGRHYHQIRAASASGSTSTNAENQDSSLAPTIGSPPSAHMSPEKSKTTIRSVGSGSTTIMDSTFSTIQVGGGLAAGPMADRSPSPLSMAFSMDAPWAGGLDRDWQPTAVP